MDDNEEIKIEVTMFDGCVFVPKPGEDNTGENELLQISLLVDISKGQGCPEIEFLCSAWPDRLDIQKVYLLHHDKIIINPYMGPDIRYVMRHRLQVCLVQFSGLIGELNYGFYFMFFCCFRKMNGRLQKMLYHYLEARGVNNELCVFLYMMNKDRIELIQWLGNVKSFVEK